MAIVPSAMNLGDDVSMAYRATDPQHFRVWQTARRRGVGSEEGVSLHRIPAEQSYVTPADLRNVRLGAEIGGRWQSSWKWKTLIASALPPADRRNELRLSIVEGKESVEGEFDFNPRYSHRRPRTTRADRLLRAIGCVAYLTSIEPISTRGTLFRMKVLVVIPY